MKSKYDEHYKNLSPQPIEVIESWGLDFHLANVLKYISRAGKKVGESELKDLEKARVYLDRKIKKLTDIEGGLTLKEFEKLCTKTYNSYKVGQVWTCANNPNLTLTIKSIHDDGVMLVAVNDGSCFDRYRYFNKEGEMEGFVSHNNGFGNNNNIFDDLQLSILKRDVVEDEDES